MPELTLKELTGRIQSRIGEELDEMAVRAEVDNIYRQLTTEHPWSFKKSHASFTSIAEYGSGTVAVTSGSPTVTLSGGSWTTAMQGRLFKAGEYPYVISSVSPTTTLTLTTEYADDTDSDATYSIRKHQYELASGVTHLLTIASQSELLEMAANTLERVDPLRESTGQPTHFVYRGMGTDGRIIELWPTPDAAYVFNYVGLSLGTFTLSSQGTEIENALFAAVFNLATAACCHTIANRKESAFWLNSGEVYKREGKEALAKIEMYDLTAFGAPKIQRNTDDRPRWDDAYIVNHDVEL